MLCLPEHQHGLQQLLYAQHDQLSGSPAAARWHMLQSYSPKASVAAQAEGGVSWLAHNAQARPTNGRVEVKVAER